MVTHDGPATAAAIVVVGLGPGDLSLLTLGAFDHLRGASHIFFRTLVHPTVPALRDRLQPKQRIDSFDALYEQAQSFDSLYDEIVVALVDAARAAAEPVVYAVPGHPLVGEQSVIRLLADAPAQDVRVQIVDGVSFLEPLCRVLSLDPLDTALQVIDGAALLDYAHAADGPDAGRWRGLAPRVLPVDRPVVLGQVYNRRVATACKLWLLERYPPEHQVQVISDAAAPEPRLRTVDLARLDHGEAFDHLTSLYVPPLPPQADVRGLATLPYLAARLRQPDGCPWDREQTWHSLKPHLLEEAFEAVSALDADQPEAVAEELGDVVLLVTMLAQIGEEAGLLDLTQVLESVNTKLVRRHPHVFGSADVSSAGEVTVQWERIKAEERSAEHSVLSGVPAGMPALIAAQVMQRKAAAVGFDWEDAAGVLAKVAEEAAEVARAATAGERLEEMGDLLFALVSLCRHLSLDAEEALRRANTKFRTRLAAVEALARAQGTALTALDAAGLDVLWKQAKQAEARRHPRA